MAFLKPRKLDKDEIAERVAASSPAPIVEHVTPLNPGFFQLERMRMELVKQRKPLKG